MEFYNSFKFIFPPRPESKIPPRLISVYDTQEFIAQPKYNGSCCSLFLDGVSAPIIINRHNETKTRVSPTIDLAGAHRGNNWMVLTGELMDKSKKGEDGEPIVGFIIWDILVYESRHLLGMSLYDRLMLLEKLYPCKRGMYVGPSGLVDIKHLCLTDAAGVYKAPTYFGGQNYFPKLYNDIVKVDAYEGLVLKKIQSKLEPGFNPSNNNLWQLKVRKPTKNYQH